MYHESVSNYQKNKDLKARPRAAEPATEIEIEDRLERLSYLMDEFIRIPGLGWRFGLDSLIGLIPGVGDVAPSLISFYILAAAVRYRVPKITLLRMGLNIGLDYLVGSIPMVGDLFDAWWKANSRNLDLLRRSATVSARDAQRGRLSDWLFVGVIMLILLAILLGSIAVVYLALRMLFTS